MDVLKEQVKGRALKNFLIIKNVSFPIMRFFFFTVPIHFKQYTWGGGEGGGRARGTLQGLTPPPIFSRILGYQAWGHDGMASLARSHGDTGVLSHYIQCAECNHLLTLCARYFFYSQDHDPGLSSTQLPNS